MSASQKKTKISCFEPLLNFMHTPPFKNRRSQKPYLGKSKSSKGRNKIAAISLKFLRSKNS